VPQVVNENGEPVPAGERGLLILKKPYPGMLMTLYKDPDRFKEAYWSRFPGNYLTGDYSIQDEDGYFWFHGRADDVITSAGYRIGPSEIEDALLKHPAVRMAAAIGVLTRYWLRRYLESPLYLDPPRTGQ
jgi:acetyl-CoA synthetase